MIAKAPDGIYRSTRLEPFAWLRHGFGTRAHPQWDLVRHAWLKQIHSDVVLAVNGRRGCAGEGDALLTRTPGALLAVKTADCLPIFLVVPEHRVVAAVHAGWRETLKRIAEKTLGEVA